MLFAESWEAPLVGAVVALLAAVTVWIKDRADRADRRVVAEALATDVKEKAVKAAAIVAAAAVEAAAAVIAAEVKRKLDEDLTP